MLSLNLFPFQKSANKEWAGSISTRLRVRARSIIVNGIFNNHNCNFIKINILKKLSISSRMIILNLSTLSELIV